MGDEKSSNMPNKDIVYEIKERVLKSLMEEQSNSMTTTKSVVSVLWRPNNYRRQLRVKVKLDSTLIALKDFALENGLKLDINGHTKLVTVRGFGGVTLQYGRNILTGIYSQAVVGGFKETFLVEADSIDGVESRLNERKKAIREKIDGALFDFSKRLGILLPFDKPKWSRHEDWIKGEDFIDKIPRETIIHDTVFKKVYGEGIEFKGGIGDEPTASLKNYIKNRAVEDIVPELIERLDRLNVDFVGKSVVIEKQIGILALAQVNTQKQLTSLVKLLRPSKEQIVKDSLSRPDYFG